MDDLDPSLEWAQHWVGRRPGTHFSADGTSLLARSDETNLLETHGVLGPRIDDDADDADESEGGPNLTPLGVGVGIGIGVLLAVGAIKVVPRIISWGKNRRAWTGSSGTGVAEDEAGAAAAVSSPMTSSAAFESEVEVALEEHRRDMSSAEAQRRIFAILVAAAFIAGQLRELSNASIDDDASAALQGAMDKLTTRQLTDSLNRMLEADASVLDDETTASLMGTFGGGQVVEGQFVPLRNEKIKDALRLPRSE